MPCREHCTFYPVIRVYWEEMSGRYQKYFLSDLKPVYYLSLKIIPMYGFVFQHMKPVYKTAINKKT